jgi:hypothetical protein
MIEAAEDTPVKIASGYSVPQIAIAVVIAVVLHGAVLGATLLTSSGQKPEAGKPAADGKTPQPATGAPGEKAADGNGFDAKSSTTETPKKSSEKSDSADELKLDDK